VGYVTNATSKSVASKVVEFLNKHAPDRIVKLKGYLELERQPKPFSREEIQNCLINQSVHFLRLYTRYISARLPQAVFRRKFYHCYSDCRLLHNDYVERDDQGNELVVWPNTGQFAEPAVQQGTYRVSQDYLKQLGMQLCRGCDMRAEDAGSAMFFTA
jgi:hypothetical protein